jgi:predicted phosphodiesterase
MTLRIAVFSDVHGNLTALNAVLAALDGHRPLQLIVAAGDHALVGPRPAEVWDALQAAGCACILGNDDELLWTREIPAALGASPWTPLVRARLLPTVAALGPARLAAIRASPRSLRLAPATGDDLLIVHANVRSLHGWALSAASTDADLERDYGGAGARVVCCGHYHEACVREWRGMTLVNVASVSIPRDGRPLAGYTILDWDGGWRVAQYRVPYDAAAEERAFDGSAIPRDVPGWAQPTG